MSLVSSASPSRVPRADHILAILFPFSAFPAAIRVSFWIYVAAVCGSLVVGLHPTVLWWVPVCFGIALGLSLTTRAAFGEIVWLAAGIEGALLICVLGLSLACLSYVCATLNLPLWDKQIVAADAYFGFDWLAAAEWFDRAPALLNILDAAYATFTGQLIVTAALLLATGRLREIDRYFVTFVYASLLAEAASLLIPTLGPASTLASTATFDHLSAIGRTTADIVLALRTGTLKVIDARALDGIISFPSLHAAVAVLIPYHLRWSRPLFCAAVVLNTLMFISAVPCGNHYLMDVVGGLLIAAFAIVCSYVCTFRGRPLRAEVPMTIVNLRNTEPDSIRRFT